MKVAVGTKLLMAAAGLVAVGAYFVIADLGINGGRIHHGVRIRGSDVDIDGLTRSEALPPLQERVEEMRASPIVFSTEGYDCRFYPYELGWQARATLMLDEAYEVGREGAPFGALWDRLTAWAAGVEVPWEDRLAPPKVTEFIHGCADRAEQYGVQVDRPRLRYKIKRIVSKWPRGVAVLPLADDA